MTGRWIAIAMLGAALLGGCVEREMTITSEPSGALVFVSDREIGRTPVTLPFTWYGDYEVILRRDGCQTLQTHAPINPPWYELPPLDLFSRMAPWTYRDQRFLHYKLEPLKELTDQQLVKDAEAMRKRNLESPAP
jgi:hypothetical protein